MSGFTAADPGSDTPVLVSHESPDACFGVANSVFVLGVEKRYRALTDLGTVIPLVRYEAVVSPDVTAKRPFDPRRDLPGFLAMLEEQFLARIKSPHCHMQRVQGINPACNCHGWTFAGGHFGVQDSYVSVILDEHGYERVLEPRAGDIAIYSADGRIIHSGFVRLTVPGHEILVETKWGPFGVFLHSAEAHPGEIVFYRTRRPSDTLKLVPVAA
jgi:hypothetical protein